MDVCVFSMYRKYQGTPEREKGEANIFSLVKPGFQCRDKSACGFLYMPWGAAWKYGD